MPRPWYIRPRGIRLLLWAFGLLAAGGPLVRAAEPRLVCELDIANFEKPKGITPPCDYLAVADDGTQLATAGSNNTIVLWDCERRTLKQYLTPARAPAEIWNTRPVALAFSPDGKQLAAMRGWTFGENKNPPKGALLLRIWPTDGKPGRGRKLESPYTFVGESQQAWYEPVLAYSPDGKCLAAGYSTVFFSWDYFQELRARFPIAQGARPPYTDANGASQTVVGVLRDGKLLNAFECRDWGFARFAFTSDSKALALWDGNTRTLTLHDLSGSTPPRVLVDFSSRSWFGGWGDMAFTRDGRTLVVLAFVNKGAEKKAIFSVDGTKARLARFDLQAEGQVTESADIGLLKKGALKLSADGDTFLAQADEGSLKVYDSATAAAIGTLSLGNDHQIQAAALSRSGRFVAISSRFGLIKVWQLEPPSAPASASRATGPLIPSAACP